MNQLDYQILLATHLVCADQQIHSQELKFLRELVTKSSVGQSTMDEKEKILAQDESLLSLENIARQILPSQQSEVMGQLLALAYIDGFFSPLEREMVIQVAKIWNWSTGKIEGFLELSAVSNTFKPIQNGTPSRDSLWDDVNYKAAIERCKKIAQEDFKFTDSALQSTKTTLDNLKTDIIGYNAP